MLDNQRCLPNNQKKSLINRKMISKLIEGFLLFFMNMHHLSAKDAHYFSSAGFSTSILFFDFFRPLRFTGSPFDRS